MQQSQFILTDAIFQNWLVDFFNGIPVSIPQAIQFSFGTAEWSNETYNTHFGCKNGCWNCYAWNGVWRRHQKGNDLYGKEMQLRPEWSKTWRNRPEKYTIMYPSVHDTIFSTIKESFAIMKNMVQAKNIYVLWVTKPQLAVIKAFIEQFREYRERITIRLTITTNNDEQLEFWESNASRYDERLFSLHALFNNGYNTSVSVEGMLIPKSDDKDLVQAEIRFINELLPYIRNTIWIGMMNHLPVHTQRGQPLTELQRKKIAELKVFYSNQNIKQLVQALYKEPKVRWKESVKKRMIQIIQQEQEA
jgi:DNA repair photolyase